jgi:hypothetical protein
MGGSNETRLIGSFGVDLLHPDPFIIVTSNCTSNPRSGDVAVLSLAQTNLAPQTPQCWLVAKATQCAVA